MREENKRAKHGNQLTIGKELWENQNGGDQ